jgi:hypothetical protein
VLAFRPDPLSKPANRVEKDLKRILEIITEMEGYMPE